VKGSRMFLRYTRNFLPECWLSHPEYDNPRGLYHILHRDSCTIKPRHRPAPKSLGHKFRAQTS